MGRKIANWIRVIECKFFNFVDTFLGEIYSIGTAGMHIRIGNTKGVFCKIPQDRQSTRIVIRLSFIQPESFFIRGLLVITDEVIINHFQLRNGK